MNTLRSIRFALALALPLSLGAVAVVPAIASADPPPAANVAPTAFDGAFQRYLLAPNGMPTGMVLADGTVVRVPPPAFQPSTSLQAGAKVHVEGGLVQTKTGNLVVRPLVTSNGTVIADARNFQGHKGHEHGDKAGNGGHRDEHGKLAAMQETGRIAMLISGPRDHIDMLILDNGTMVSARGLDSLGLKVGDQVTAQGRGGSYPQGKAMHARSLTTPDGKEHELRGKGHGHHHGQGTAPAGSPA